MEFLDVERKRQKTKLTLEEVYNLPAMSKMILEVSKLLDDPQTNNSSLEKMISKDQGIASKILSIANSPIYGLRRKVSTIDFAILVVGFADMKSIVLALSIMEALKVKSDKFFDHVEFWKHSTIMGAAAKRISEDLGYNNSGEALVAALLHDMGIGVIQRYFNTEFAQIYSSVHYDGSSFEEAEIQYLGYTHQEIGQMVCENWNLPENLCNIIRYHEDPSNAGKDNAISAIIHIADYLTQKFQIGNFYWDKDITLKEELVDILHFSNINELNEFMDGYRSLFENEQENIKVI